VFDDQDAAMSALYFGSYANDVFRYGALDPANPSAGAQPGREGPIDSSGSFYRGWGGDDQYLGAYHYGDTFFGDAGDDLILGADLGADYIPVDGRGDSDQLYGGGGSDIIVGGKGNDLLYGDFARVRISGTDPTDLSLVTSVALDTWFAVLSGGRYVSAESRTPFEANLQVDYDDGLGFEVMLRYQLGLGDAQDSDGFFDDFVSGAQGDDRIFGGYGSDTLLGGDGDDFIDGDTPGFSDTNLPLELRPLFGRAGDDFLDGGEGNDDLRDHRGGNDVFLAGAGDDVLSNSDTFAGDEDAAPESVSNYLDGGDGDDTITSYNNSIKGFDHASGGAGNDTITVGSDARFGGGEVSVSGGDGDDHISVGSLNGHVDGGDGDDDIYVEGFEDDLQDDELDGYEGVTVFGGAGNDTISTYGRIDVDGGDGDDIIEWMAAERQTATGFITGGAGNDRIRASGAAIIDAGAGDDEIISMSGESHITPGAGRDRVVVDLSSGRASDIVLDLSGAGPNDELLFKRFPGNGAPAMQVQSDLLIQRAGNDLQLELVRNQGGADAVSEARVLIPDWFSGGAPQLASITVEGMRTWTSADVAALVVVVPEVLPPDFPPQQDVSPTPDVDGAGAMPDAEMITPAIVLAPSVRVENPALSDLLASLGPVAAVPSVSEDTTNSDSSAVTPSAEPGSSESGRDSIEAFLARLADRSEYDFSFVSGLVEGVRQQRTDDFAPRVNPAQLAGQWNALHAYMDALAASPDTDQRIAAPTEPAPGLGALLRTGAGSFEQTGVIETARVGISDSSLAGLRPLQGLTEGFAQLG
jgi:Ca2+-binding RTX toxin-like protein